MSGARLGTAYVALAAVLLARSAAAEPTRTLPDYDGRGGEPNSTTDTLLWVPRVILAPPYLVSEYVLRRPLGALIADAERAGWPAVLYNFFAFGTDHKAGIVPTLFVDFGFLPSVGLYVFWDDAFVRGHDVRLHVGTWGPNWIGGSFSERMRLTSDPRDVVRLDVAASRRPDHAFFGIGPRTLESSLQRFGEDCLDATVGVDEGLWRMSALHAHVGVRSVGFRRGAFGTDAILDDSVASGAFPAPPGYPQGYTVARSELSVVIDTRRARPAPGSGVRVALQGSESSDPRARSGWVTYGGTAGAFVDLNDRERVLSVSVTTLFADPLGREAIPFTELVQLGGYDTMRGFFPGRLVDRSAAVAAVAYRWPIWIWLDGAMRVEVGDVFDEHLRDFKPGLLRLSTAVGVESNGSPDNVFEVLLGFGSETFESGAKVDSIRLVVGTNHGF